MRKFKKGDKGTWIVNSEMVIEPKGKDMETRGMVLYINRNTRTTKGYYFISEMKMTVTADQRMMKKGIRQNGT